MWLCKDQHHPHPYHQSGSELSNGDRGPGLLPSYGSHICQGRMPLDLPQTLKTRRLLAVRCESVHFSRDLDP